MIKFTKIQKTYKCKYTYYHRKTFDEKISYGKKTLTDIIYICDSGRISYEVIYLLGVR